MMSRVAFISSNQHRNAYVGMKGVTEESVMQDITAKAEWRVPRCSCAPSG